jgi:hypothetical protein
MMATLSSLRPSNSTAHPGDFLFRADEDEAAFVLGLRHVAPQNQPHQFFLRPDQREADDAEKRNHAARHD